MSAPSNRSSLSSPALPWRTWLAALALALAAGAAYHNSFAVPFLFDDVPAIVENPAIRQLWPFGTDQPGGLTTSGRPLLGFSLALNHLFHGEAVGGYHAVNLAIHVGAGLLLLGVVRRTLLLPPWREHLGAHALPLALAVAAGWTLHPLQTESVTYIVQRAESLAGFFYLGTIYAFIRSTTAARPAGWHVLTVGLCLLGMASKEVVVSAPLVVLLFDRTFVCGTFRGAWTRHRRLYAWLGATWLVLALLVLSNSGRGGTAGFGTALSPWDYALTQCRAIFQYLQLVVWPHPLVFDYGLGTVRDLREVLPQALGVLGLLGFAVVALRRWPVAGFLAASFLLLLAPSSSIVPIVTQTMAEHRMYLPLAPVVAGIVLALHRWLGTRAWAVLALVAGMLGVATVTRNRDYRSEVAIWAATADYLPGNARAHNNLGQALFRAGRIEEAMARYARALELQPKYPETHYNLGVALARLDRVPEAIGHYEAALRFQADYPEAHNNLGNALVRAGRGPEAMRHYERALALRPGFAEAHNNLGNALLQAGRAAAAAECFARAIALKPDYAEAHYNLGNTRAAAGDMPAALVEYDRALALKSDYAEAQVNAGNALLALGRPSEALQRYERAVALNPVLPDAHFNRGSTLLDLERWAEAIPPLEAAVRLKPDFLRAERALGFALGRAGRLAEAQPHYERYLRLQPEDAEAREEWRRLRTLSSDPR